jgi:endonuclease YncB( thermonuclease family)
LGFIRRSKVKFVAIVCLLIGLGAGIEIQSRYDIRAELNLVLDDLPGLLRDVYNEASAIGAAPADYSPSRKVSKRNPLVLEGRVSSVRDGDSVLISIDNRRAEIRLHQIDAPEYDQPWGKQAGRALARKIDRASVRVEVVDVDQYERLVGTIYRNGRDINREMVREGHAWVYRRYLTDRSLLKDEKQAQRAKLGLWANDRKPIAPWDWRQRRKQSL